MAKYLTAACATLVATLSFYGSSTEASAGCRGCGPVPPVYNYRTVNKVVNRTQFRDVQRTHYVHRTRHIFNVTRVQPIVRVHTVTRVLARSLDHPRCRGRQAAQVLARGLVGAVLVPHRREDAELSDRGLAADEL